MNRIFWVFILAACLTGGNLWARGDGDREDRGDRRENSFEKGYKRAPKAEVEKEAPAEKVEKPAPKKSRVYIGGRKSVPAKADPAPQAPVVEPAHVVGNKGQDREFNAHRSVEKPGETRGYQGLERKPGNEKPGVENRGFGVRPESAGKPADANSRFENRRSFEARPVQPGVAKFDQARHKPIFEHKPKPILDRKQLVVTPREKSVVALPQHGPDGKVFKARLVTHAPRVDRMRPLSDRKFVVELDLHMKHETQRGRYYWHDRGGSRYCHYYDHSGYHWYGWWWGGDYHWTRYHHGRHWWYDNLYDRWCWWNDGYWWWQDPVRTNVVYVYNDGQYITADEDLRVPDEGPYPPSGSAKKAFSDQTGSRLVKVFNSTRDAFLYDTAEPPAFKPVFLDSGVKEAQFSYDGRGRTRQVVLFLTNGSVEVFDARGNAFQAQAENN